MTNDATVGQACDDALSAYEELQGLAEDVEDEWSYIQDLTGAWRTRIDELIAARGSEAATEQQSAAVVRGSEEIARITDPHRAIDWLSTFPQIVLIAFEERP